MRIAALFLYPVKDLTPVTCGALSVVEGGRVAGDRVLGFRFANSAASDSAWSSKHEFVALVNTPELARLRVRFDHESHWLSISSPAGLLVDEKLDNGNRERIAKRVEELVLCLAINPLLAHPDRLPLRLVGDGNTPRYQVTLHSRESLASVAAQLKCLI